LKWKSERSYIENKSKLVYESKSVMRSKKIHDMHDNDISKNLGYAPGTKDGSKEKTYEFAKKKLFGELKDLKSKDSLSKTQR
jgi:hypothetical protein